MSRTYHHGRKAKERKYGNPFMPWRLNAEAPPKKARQYEPWNWMTTPSSWIYIMMERPQRAKTRMLLSKVKDGSEDVVLPLARKPHVYYW